MRITGGKTGGGDWPRPTTPACAPPPTAPARPSSTCCGTRILTSALPWRAPRVLDLFAGTGALGIEALSHGARWCLLVDDSAESRALQRENIEALGLTGATRIWRRDATDLGPIGPAAGGPFELVFLDPPYRKEMIPKALASLEGRRLAGGQGAAGGGDRCQRAAGCARLHPAGRTRLWRDAGAVSNSGLILVMPAKAASGWASRIMAFPFAGMTLITAARTASRYRRASAPHRSGGHDCIGRNGAWLPFRAAGRSSLRH